MYILTAQIINTYSGKVSHFSMERVCTTDSDNDMADFVIHSLSIYPHGYGKNTTAFAEQGHTLVPSCFHVKCIVDSDGRSAEVRWWDAAGWMSTMGSGLSPLVAKCRTWQTFGGIRCIRHTSRVSHG